MPTTHNLSLLLAALGVLWSGSCAAQKDSLFTSKPYGKGRHSLVAYASGGAGYFFSGRGAPEYLQPNLRRVNPMGTVRLLWHPDHLLKLGLETGYVRFYSYGLTDSAGNRGRISLDAVPVLLVWSMSVSRHLNIFAGTGGYFLQSRLDYLGKVNASKFNMGWMAAASWVFPVGKQSGLGAEFKWLYASETANGVLSLNLQYVWRFARW